MSKIKLGRERNKICKCGHRFGSHNIVERCSVCRCRKLKPTNNSRTWKEEFIILAVEALESCWDNYGSEAADNGQFERHYDPGLVDNALKVYKANKKGDRHSELV